jgi:hypothetical protein
MGGNDDGQSYGEKSTPENCSNGQRNIKIWEISENFNVN